MQEIQIDLGGLDTAVLQGLLSANAEERQSATAKWREDVLGILVEKMPPILDKYVETTLIPLASGIWRQGLTEGGELTMSVTISRTRRDAESASLDEPLIRKIS